MHKKLIENAKKIKEEVKEVMSLWGNKGGMILAPSYKALPETPIKNMLAIYEQIMNGSK